MLRIPSPPRETLKGGQHAPDFATYFATFKGGQYLPDCHTKYCMQTRKNKSINSRQGGQLAPDYPIITVREKTHILINPIVSLENI